MLVIEAGSEDPDLTSVLGLLFYFQHSQWNWGFNTTPQANACFSKCAFQSSDMVLICSNLGKSNKQCDYPRGKLLGGCSEINGGFYVRGNKKDYDRWEELGNVGWSYDDVLPYFKLSEYENFTDDIDTSYHGFDGPQSIAFPPEIVNLVNSISVSKMCVRKSLRSRRLHCQKVC